MYAFIKNPNKSNFKAYVKNVISLQDYFTLREGTFFSKKVC